MRQQLELRTSPMPSGRSIGPQVRHTNKSGGASIPPTWGTGKVRKLRGAKEIAEYHCGTAQEYRTVYNECARGSLPHWREGAMICCNTLVIDLYKLLQMVYRLRRKEFTAAEAVKCISLFGLAMQGIRPSQDDIAAALKKAGVI